MVPGQSALKIHIVGLPQRSIRRELNGRTLYKGTGCHDYLILIARHCPGYRCDKGIHRRTGLDALTEPAQRLWCTEETADISVFDERRFDLRNAGLVIGNEANGISDTTLGTPVTIPMPGHAESLNVAQATTVFLFEAVRRGLL